MQAVDRRRDAAREQAGGCARECGQGFSGFGWSINPDTAGAVGQAISAAQGNLKRTPQIVFVAYTCQHDPAVIAKAVRSHVGPAALICGRSSDYGLVAPDGYHWSEKGSLGVLMMNVEDMASAFLRLDNGGVITLRVSWAANVPDSAGGVLIMGTQGGLEFDPRKLDLRLVKNMGRYQVDITPKLPPPQPDHPFYAHWKEIAHFVRAIRGEEELCVKKEEALNVL